MRATRHICASMIVMCAAAFGGAPVRASCPELLVPAYQYPTVGTMWASLSMPTEWARVNVIINPNSGPGTSFDAVYGQAINGARVAGCRLFAYVFTSYGARPSASVMADVQSYITMYGPIDGVFLDEMDNQASSLAHYQLLRSQIQSLIPGAVVIGNPGTRVPESFFAQNAADVIVTYENDANAPGDPYAAAVPDAWTASYPANRFAHIVYGVGTPAEMKSTLGLAASRRAGWIYITNDQLPNPYDTLPPYWELERRGCIADFNCMAGVSVQDIFDYLGAWFAGATRADINAVGGVTVQDLFDFLAAWFASC